MIKGWGRRGTADTELLEAEQCMHQWQLPPAFADVGSAIQGCWVCRARQECSEAPVAGSSALDGERLFLVFSGCQALVGSGLLLHTLFIAVGLMLLVVSDGRCAEHSALFAAWQMFR